MALPQSVSTCTFATVETAVQQWKRYMGVSTEVLRIKSNYTSLGRLSATKKPGGSHDWCIGAGMLSPVCTMLHILAPIIGSPRLHSTLYRMCKSTYCAEHVHTGTCAPYSIIYMTGFSPGMWSSMEVVVALWSLIIESYFLRLSPFMKRKQRN